MIDFTIFILRDTSQDGLENFFGCVNACNYSNKATPMQYRTGYATMNINNFTGTNSLHTNCQPDKSKPILTHLHEFITEFEPQSNDSSNEVSKNINEVNVFSPQFNQKVHFSEGEAISNVIDADEMILYDPESDEEVNFAVAEATSNVMDVDEMILYDPECDEEVNFSQVEAISNIMDLDEMVFLDPESDEEEIHFIESEATLSDTDNMIVTDPQFEKEGLINFIESEAISQASKHTSQKLMKCTNCEECKRNLVTITENDSGTEAIFVRHCSNILFSLSDAIPRICSEESIKKKLMLHIESIKIDSIGCPEHDIEIIQKMKQICVDHTVTIFCSDINNILSGKTKVLPVNHDPIQKLAYEHKAKKKKIGKYSDIFNMQ